MNKKFSNFSFIDNIKRFRGIFPTRLNKYRLDANERVSDFDVKFIERLKKLGIEVKLSYQWARHSFATNMKLANNVSDRAIQEAMGHKHQSTTQNYIDSLYDEQSESIIEALKLGDK